MLKAFLSGFGIGVGLGLLYAPRSGNELRRQLRDAGSEMGERAGEMAERLPGGREAMRRVSESLQPVREAAERQAARVVEMVPQALRGGGGSLLDRLNSASHDELLAVPGIGPVTAERIIQGRPYASEDDVVGRGVLTRNGLDSVREHLARAAA